MYLFLAVLGLACWEVFSVAVGEQGLLLRVVFGLVTAVAPLCCGAHSTDSRARGLQRLQHRGSTVAALGL